MSNSIVNAVIVGATGLVGKKLLLELHQLENCQNIRVIVRRHEASFEHLEKVEQVIRPNLLSLNQQDVDGFNHAFSCLGTTLKKAGSRTAFYQTDYGLNAHFASLLAKQQTHLILVSALGADKHSRFFYNRVKGELEEYLQSLALEKLSILRPSLLLGHRGEARRLEDLSQYVFNKISPWMPKNFAYTPVTAEQVAHTMVVAAQMQTQKIEIYDNLRIQQT